MILGLLKVRGHPKVIGIKWQKPRSVLKSTLHSTIYLCTPVIHRLELLSELTNQSHHGESPTIYSNAKTKTKKEHVDKFTDYDFRRPKSQRKEGLGRKISGTLKTTKLFLVLNGSNYKIYTRKD